MSYDPSPDREEGINELLKLYNNMRNGLGGVFLEEEAFEKIIDHYDDQEELAKALEVAETAIEYFPFSAPLFDPHHYPFPIAFSKAKVNATQSAKR